ncbi:methylated-DNA--protein-cysteine methyltransferase-like [Glandiceps talaboti]
MTTSCSLATVWLNSPIGEIIVSCCQKGVHKIQLTATESLHNQDGVSETVEMTKQEGDEMKTLTQCMDWLNVYFIDIDEVRQLPLPPLHVSTKKPDSFTAQVWKTLTEDVPIGKTVSYGELAEMVGNAKACRAVGGAMRSNQVPLIIPCHRVVGSQGYLGNYMSGKGIPIKKWLLRHEGIEGF